MGPIKVALEISGKHNLVHRLNSERFAQFIGHKCRFYYSNLMFVNRLRTIGHLLRE